MDAVSRWSFLSWCLWRHEPIGLRQVAHFARFGTSNLNALKLLTQESSDEARLRDKRRATYLISSLHSLCLMQNHCKLSERER